MALSINTNVMSLNAQRNLSSSGEELATSLQRLSSGMRINSAKDDAAGLAISERFTTQIRGMDQAARNANDGISLSQTAEGAMGEIGNNLQRIRELAVQSRNATNSASDRAALNAEASQLKAEIDRVAGQTSFNGTRLLDGSFTNQAFQVGANQGETISVSSIVNANSTSLGSWNAVDLATSTGVAPSASGATAATATTSGTSGAFTTATSSAASQSFTFAVGGLTIFTKTTAASGETVTAANIDTALSTNTALASAGISFTGKAADGNLAFSRADGTDFTIAVTSTFATTPGSFATAAFTGTHTNGTEAAATSLTALSGAAFTINGTNITVGAAADKATRLADLMTAINASNTGVTASISSNALQLTSAADIIIGGTGAVSAQTGLTSGTAAAVDGAAQIGFASLDISTVAGADAAMLAMDGALTAINGARADMGAVQNRFSSVVANLSSTTENLTAARSRIQDADFAKESAQLSRNQILQQAGTAMLAQANQSSQGVLSLLR